jgi:hypothetical protein
VIAAPKRAAHAACRRRITTSRVLVVVALAAAGVALVALYTAMSDRAVLGNADGATVILEGLSIHAGNLRLHGWTLSLDSFWTVDALFYALGIVFFGLGPILYHVIPALLAALCVGIAAVLGRDGRRGAAGLAAVTLVGLVLVTSPPDLWQFLLAGPLHVGTALYCLAAFALLARAGSVRARRTADVVAAVLLIAAAMGDLQALTYGIVPVIGAALLEVARTRRWGAGLRLAGVGVGSAIGAVAFRALGAAIGVFHLVAAEQPATLATVPGNVGRFLGDALELLGVRDVIFGTMGPQPLVAHIARVVLLIVVVGGALVACVRLVIALVRGPEVELGARVPGLQAMLVLAFLASSAQYFLLAALPGNYSRYVTVPVICATVLAARELGGLVARLSDRRVLAGFGVVGLGLLVILGVTVGLNLSKPSLQNPKVPLAAFLAAHHLTLGLSDYPTASVVTVESHGSVVLRPVIERPGKRLVRWARQTDASWYAGVPFTFVVVEPRDVWRGVNAVIAELTFGRPASILETTGYEVLVYNHPLSVSTVGSEGNRLYHRKSPSQSAKAAD